MIFSFQRLIQEHRVIQDRARTLRHANAAGAEIHVRHAALTALADELVDHLAHEDAEIYPQLMMAADSGAAEAASIAVTRFESLASDFLAYVARWDEDAIAADPDGFTLATEALLARLDARIHQENELLYPMALRGAYITLRDSLAA